MAMIRKYDLFDGVRVSVWYDLNHPRWRVLRVPSFLRGDSRDYKYPTQYVIQYFSNTGHWYTVDEEDIRRYLGDKLPVRGFLGSYTLPEAKYLLGVMMIAMGG